VKAIRRFLTLLPWALPVLDLVGIAVCFLAAHLAVLGLPLRDFYLPPLLIAMMFVPFVFDAFRLYRPWRGDSLPRELIRVTTAWLAFLTGLVVLAALSKVTALYSRIWAATWTSLGIIWFTGTRIVLRTMLGRLRAAGLNLKRVLLVGNAPMLLRLTATLHENPRAGFVPAGYVAPERFEVPELAELSYLGDISRLRVLTSGPYRNIDEVWIEKFVKGHGELGNGLSFD